jgi:hypothetical protein
MVSLPRQALLYSKDKNYTNLCTSSTNLCISHTTGVDLT